MSARPRRTVRPAPGEARGTQRIQASLQRHGKVDIVLLLVAVTSMSTARYRVVVVGDHRCLTERGGARDIRRNVVVR